MSSPRTSGGAARRTANSPPNSTDTDSRCPTWARFRASAWPAPARPETHGSGDTNGVLATAVREIELVGADGRLVTLCRGDEPFAGSVIGLGALGIVTSLTLDLVPAFDMRQDLYNELPAATFAEHFDEITSSAYSVSLFTDWRGPVLTQVWLKRRVACSVSSEPSTAEPARRWFGAAPATRRQHPVLGEAADNCTEQLGVTGPWHQRLPHFRRDSCRAAGTSCSRSTSWREPTRWRPSRRCTGSATGSRRCCSCRKSARSPPTSCG